LVVIRHKTLQFFQAINLINPQSDFISIYYIKNI